MQKIEAEIREPEIRAGEGLHEFVPGDWLLSRAVAGGPAVGGTHQVLIWTTLRVNDRKFFAGAVPCGTRFVNTLPIGWRDLNQEARRYLALVAIRIADFQRAAVTRILVGLLIQQMSDEQFSLALAFGAVERRRGTEFVGGLADRKPWDEQQGKENE
jgi:hypothetical protein